MTGAHPHLMHGLPGAQLSRAIGLSRIALIVGLIFLHYGSFPNSLATPFQGVDTQQHQLATWLNSAILFFFFSAVPLLSMISGWLFFSFSEEEAGEALKKRIRRRFVSLYLPLVVWNLAYLAVLYALFAAKPDLAFFANSTRFNLDFAAADLWGYLNAITGLTDIPIAFQFWFVRDLFVTVLVSPVFWLLLKRLPWIGAALLAAVWLSGHGLWLFFRFDVPFFFYLGALIRRQRVMLTVPLTLTLGLLALYLLLAGLRALAPYAVVFENGENPFWLDTATRAMRLIGVVGCWGVLYRVAETKTGAWLSGFGGLAFFLHSAHWPLLAIVKVGLWKVTPGDSDGWMLLHYLASVTVTTLIGLAAGIALAKLLPRVFALMNGGRLLEQHGPGAAALPAAAPHSRAREALT